VTGHFHDLDFKNPWGGREMAVNCRCVVCVASFSALTLLAGCSSAPSGYAKGVADANAAIAAGTLKLKEYPPLPSPGYYGEYIQLLRDRGIGYEVPSLPPGVSEAVFREEVRGWNQTMNQQINLKLGSDTLAHLQEQAEKHWSEQHPGPK
jgi:hypothetical protein